MSTKVLSASYILDASGISAGVATADTELGSLGNSADQLGQDFDKNTTRMGGALQHVSNTMGSFGLPFSGAVGKMGKNLDDAKAKGQGFGQLMSDIGGVTLGVTAIGVAAVGAESVKLANDFQSTVTSIAANANIPVAAAQKIGAAFLSTAGTTIYSGQAIASAYAPVAAQLGTVEGKALNSSQALTVMKAAMDLAEGSGENLATTTSALASVMQVYHDKVGVAANVSDTLFNVSRLTDTSLGSVSNTVDKLHGRLGATTPSLSQVGTLMADLAGHGAAGRQAISGLSTAITGMLAPSSKQADLIKVLGLNVYNSSGQFVGFGSVLDQLQSKFANLNPQQQLNAASTLFGKTAYQGMLQVINGGPAQFDKWTVAVNRQGSAHVAATKQSQTMQHQIELLKSSVDDYAVDLGQMLIPKLMDLEHYTADVVSWFSQHKVAAEALAAVIGGVLTAAVGVFTVNMVTGMIASAKSALTSLGLLSAETEDEAGTTEQLTAALTALETQLAALTTPTEAVQTAQDAVNVAWEAADDLTTTLDAGLTSLAASFDSLGASAETAAGEVGTFDGAIAAAGAASTVAAGEMDTAGLAAEGAGAKMSIAGDAAGSAGMAGGMVAGEGAATGLAGALGPVAIAAGAVVGGAYLLNKAFGTSATVLGNAATAADMMAQSTLPQMTLKMGALTSAQRQLTAALKDGTDRNFDDMLAFTQLGSQIDTLRNQQTNLTNNVQLLSSNFGISKGQAQSLAQELGINLASALSPAQVTAFRQQIQESGLDMDTTGSKAKNMGATTVAAVSSMAANMKTVLSSQDWTALGQSVDQGVASGITQSNGVVINSVNGMVTSVISAARTGLRAASPSRVAADMIGATIPQGVGVGITENASTAVGAMRSMMEGVVGAGAGASIAGLRVGAEIPTSGAGPAAGAGAGVAGATSMNVYVTVQGSVLSERNLTDAVWQGLLEKGVVNGTSGQLAQTGG